MIQSSSNLRNRITMEYLQSRNGIHLQRKDKKNKKSYGLQVTPIFKIFNEDFNAKHNLNQIRRQTFKGFEYYCSSSSLHGLKYVGDRKVPNLERLFWLVSFILAIGFALFFIINLYQKYDQSPVIISFNPKMVKINEIPFPSITICNVNMALKSRADYLNAYGTYENKQFLSDLCNMNSSFQNGTKDYDGSGLDWPVVRGLIISVNQKCTEMFKICKWDGKYQKCNELINTILTDEGYCCSFNKLPDNYSLRNYDENLFNNNYPHNIIDWNPEEGYPNNAPLDSYPYRSFGSGQSLGLTIVLDANLAQYYCTTTSSTGFKALLSTPIESPKVADIGLLLAPGEEIRIAIEADIEDATKGVESIHYKKRQCFFTHEKYLRFYRFYTERNCRMECEANFTLKRCGCVPYYLPKDQHTKICGQETEACSDEAKFIVERFSPERNLCDCLPACYEITYSPMSASSGKIKKDIDTVREELRQNISMDYFAENMAVVHFYFPYDKIAKRTKSEVYGFSEFLSNTGGLLGLFMGFSFLSAVEIIYFLCISNVCKFVRMGFTPRKPISVYPYVN